MDSIEASRRGANGQTSTSLTHTPADDKRQTVRLFVLTCFLLETMKWSMTGKEGDGKWQV